MGEEHNPHSPLRSSLAMSRAHQTRNPKGRVCQEQTFADISVGSYREVRGRAFASQAPPQHLSIYDDCRSIEA